MKTIFSVVLAVAFCSIALGQDEPSKKMPPIKMLMGKPGEVKYIYELPDSSKYSIYDQLGKLVESGHAEFINYTDYKPGTYFIQYDGITRQFERKATGKKEE